MNGILPNVSGEPVVVLPGEAMVRLVRAAAAVASASLGRYAIIGGVAVSARLNQAHRATTDLDAVVDDSTPPPAVETLLHLPGATADPSAPHRVLIDGIKVEIQGTDPFEPAELEGLTDRQVLYVGAHRYGLESSAPITLVARDSKVRATVPMATPGALMAMKLHAIEDRRPTSGTEKRAGDAWDMYRILLDLHRDGSVRNELARLPNPLRRVVRDALSRIFVDRVTRTVGWLKAGDDRMSAVSAEELIALATPVIEAIDQAEAGP